MMATRCPCIEFIFKCSFVDLRYDTLRCVTILVYLFLRRWKRTASLPARDRPREAQAPIAQSGGTPALARARSGDSRRRSQVGSNSGVFRRYHRKDRDGSRSRKAFNLSAMEIEGRDCYRGSREASGGRHSRSEHRFIEKGSACRSAGGGAATPDQGREVSAQPFCGGST